MQLIEINPHNKADWRRFHRVPHYIYRNDPHWIAKSAERIAAINRPPPQASLFPDTPAPPARGFLLPEGIAQCP